MGCFTFVKVMMVLFNLFPHYTYAYKPWKGGGVAVFRRVIAFAYLLPEIFMCWVKY